METLNFNDEIKKLEKKTFGWINYQKMNFYEIEENFETKFYKRQFFQAACFLILAVKANIGDLQFYLINLISKKFTLTVKNLSFEEIENDKNIICELVIALKKKAEKDKKYENMDIILPKDSQYKFGSFAL